MTRTQKDVVRKHRRIRLVANIGLIGLALLTVMLESNSARLAVVGVVAVFSVVIASVVLKSSRCPQCGSHLSTRDLGRGQTKVTVPWFFRSSCGRCGWQDGDTVAEES